MKLAFKSMLRTRAYWRIYYTPGGLAYHLMQKKWQVKNFVLVLLSFFKGNLWALLLDWYSPLAHRIILALAFWVSCPNYELTNSNCSVICQSRVQIHRWKCDLESPIFVVYFLVELSKCVILVVVVCNSFTDTNLGMWELSQCMRHVWVIAPVTKNTDVRKSSCRILFFVRYLTLKPSSQFSVNR